MEKLIGPKPLYLPFRVQRNEDFLPAEFQATAVNDAGDTVAIDLTEITLSMQVRKIGGTGGLVVSLTETATPAVTGIRKTDAANGKFEICIKAEVWGTPLPDEMETWIGAYDLVFTHADDIREVMVRGSFTVEPGVTV